MKQYITIAQAATYCHLTESSIRSWVRQGILKETKFNDVQLIDPDELDLLFEFRNQSLKSNGYTRHWFDQWVEHKAMLLRYAVPIETFIEGVIITKTFSVYRRKDNPSAIVRAMFIPSKFRIIAQTHEHSLKTQGPGFLIKLGKTSLRYKSEADFLHLFEKVIEAQKIDQKENEIIEYIFDHDALKEKLKALLLNEDETIMKIVDTILEVKEEQE